MNNINYILFDKSLIIQIFLWFLFILIDGFLTAIEISIVSLNKNKIKYKIKENNSKISKKLLFVLNNMSNYLSTIQICSTILNILLSSSLIGKLFLKLSFIVNNFLFFLFNKIIYLNFLLNFNFKYISYIIVIFFFTYISIIFVELYPQSIAIMIPEKIILISFKIIKVFECFMLPLVWLFTITTKFLYKITPINFNKKFNNKISKDEIKYTLFNECLLENKELKILHGIFSFNNKIVKNIMIPKKKIFMINNLKDIEKNINLILIKKFSKIPIFDKKKFIIRIIYIKDLLLFLFYKNNKIKNIKLEKILKKPLFISETISISKLFYKMKKTSNNIAIVLKEKKKIIGLITLKDILKEIFGNY